MKDNKNGDNMPRKIKELRQFIANMDKVSLILMIILFGFGLFSIVSASTREAVNNLNQSVYYYFGRQIFILSVCVAIYVIVLCIPTKNYNRFLVFLAWLIVLGLNAYLVFRGSSTRGANNWIKIPIIGFQLQPGELAKPILIVMTALLIESRAKYFRNPHIKHWKGILLLLVVGLSTAALIFLENDLGTALINVAIFGVMFLASPIIKKEKWATIGIGFSLVLVMVMTVLLFNINILSDEQKSRLTNFADPCDIRRRNDEGYQICNAYIAMNLGGATGVGIGKSTQKYSYIPEPHTDMIFSIISEEDGFFVGAGIIILYMVLITRILMLSSRALTISNKFICLGVATYIFLHILINLGGLFGVLPLTGVPLPFMSYGGSFAIMLTLSLAIVQRIYVETKSYRVKF